MSAGVRKTDREFRIVARGNVQELAYTNDTVDSSNPMLAQFNLMILGWQGACLKVMGSVTVTYHYCWCWGGLYFVRSS